MPDPTKDFVALFIDWDNIAISVAADLNGATPDVKRIVQTAQQYGTILIARAYAEWTATSERLNVYRAGIDTVYAPTFRYETDPVTQTSRGKSLADPCMVADCVDILHLLPSITTFVVVSGDKDLIPVVRLAQLRGKRVVVIGPDYAAGVLREIADEFISYRKVLEGGNGRGPAEVIEPMHVGRHRPPGRAGMGQPMEQPSRSSRSGAVAPQPARHRGQGPRLAISQVETISPVAPTHEVLAAEPAIRSEAPAETVEKQIPDLQTVQATVMELLRQRTAEGKPRTRATNLKDSLMVKVPGFSERRYGYSKFKDFLTAMEKTGDVAISSAGPVHWVSLPVSSPEKAPVQPEEAPVAPAEFRFETLRAPETAENVTGDEQQADLVKFLLDLKSRSRWLTYTYVLTNLISHLGKVRPGQNAEAAARSALNQLVQDGVLKVDREPQEVEVGGIKHRVRMCHLQDSHRLVRQLVGEATEAAEPAELIAETQITPEAQAPVNGEIDGVEPAIELLVGDDRVVEEPEQLEPAEVSAEPGEGTEAPPEEPAAPSIETHPIPEVSGLAGAQTSRWPEAAGIVDQVQQAILESQRLSEARTNLPVEEKLDSQATAKAGAAVNSVEDAFAALRQIVQQSTGPKKPRVGMAGLKAKLNGKMGHFDEQEFGFSRFKDFLAAAEKAGYVSLERAGSSVLVGPPPMAEDGAGEVPMARQENGAQPEKRRRRGGRKKAPAETTV